MEKFKKNRPGVTLIELILSMAIIGMIIISFMPLFAMSAKNNGKSEDTLSATYLGKNAMELAYYFSENEDISYEGDLADEMDIKGYDDLSNHAYGKSLEGKYIHIKFDKNDKKAKVVVKVYQDESQNQLEVQYESLYIWKEEEVG